MFFIMKKETYDITGMTCSACSARVEKTAAKLTGVQTVSVNLLTNNMKIEYDESALTQSEIVSAIEKAGYGAAPRDAAPVMDSGRHIENSAVAHTGSGGQSKPANANEQHIRGMKHRLIC